MAWARIDDNFFSHPKIRKAGNNAAMLYLAALCHSNAYMTEGYIADDVLDLIGIQAFQNDPKQSADRLVECGLFIRIDDGYLIHDFLEYNYSRQQINDIKTKRAEAGRQGGRPTKQTESKLKANEKQIALQNESKTKANEKQNESHTHTHTHTPSHTHINPITPTPTDNAQVAVFSVYENEIGLLTPFVTDEIKGALEDYSEEWIIEALKESAAQNKRSWKYALAILKRWKAQGHKSDSRSKEKVDTNLEKFRRLYKEKNNKENNV